MQTTYSTAQMALHWIVVLLLAAQFIFAEGMEDAFEVREPVGAEGVSESRVGGTGEVHTPGAGAAPASALPAGALVHMLLGAALFLTMALRLGLRLTRGAPAAPEQDPPWQRRLSRTVHGLLYVLLLGMPVAGTIAWFGSSEALAEAHGLAAGVLLGAAALHVAGAVYGQFIQKTGVLGRMLRPATRR
jgi:cytochrome b561